MSTATAFIEIEHHELKGNKIICYGNDNTEDYKEIEVDFDVFENWLKNTGLLSGGHKTVYHPPSCSYKNIWQLYVCPFSNANEDEDWEMPIEKLLTEFIN